MGDGEPRRGRGPWIGLLLAGTALWGAYRLARPPRADVIAVSAPTVDGLRERFEQQQGRPPTEAELQGLVTEWVDTEILVREARARGLHRADPIVRRRLAQAMRFVLEDADRPADPGDEVLDEWRRAHAEDYRRPARRGFTQVFVAGSDAAAEARARELAEELRGGADPTSLGDALAHGPRQPPASIETIAGRYGDAFARAVEAAPLDRWVPVASSLGWHVIRIDEERPGSLPELARIRERVLADWRVQERAARLEAGMQGLRGRYAVEVER